MSDLVRFCSLAARCVAPETSLVLVNLGKNSGRFQRRSLGLALIFGDLRSCGGCLSRHQNDHLPSPTSMLLDFGRQCIPRLYYWRKVKNIFTLKTIRHSLTFAYGVRVIMCLVAVGAVIHYNPATPTHTRLCCSNFVAHRYSLSVCSSCPPLTGRGRG